MMEQDTRPAPVIGIDGGIMLRNASRMIGNRTDEGLPAFVDRENAARAADWRVTRQALGFKTRSAKRRAGWLATFGMSLEEIEAAGLGKRQAMETAHD